MTNQREQWLDISSLVRATVRGQRGMLYSYLATWRSCIGRRDRTCCDCKQGHSAPRNAQCTNKLTRSSTANLARNGSLDPPEGKGSNLADADVRQTYEPMAKVETWAANARICVPAGIEVRTCRIFAFGMRRSHGPDVRGASDTRDI